MSYNLNRSYNFDPANFCRYIHRYCNQRRLDGYDYCIRHILEDKTAPFRQCTYVNQPNHKRCPNAAPKTEKNDRRDLCLCPFHSKKAQMRSKLSHLKRRTAESENLLDKLFTNGCQLIPSGSSHAKAYIEDLDDECTSAKNHSHPLDNAGAFSDKEVLSIAQEKMINLHQLYQDELQILFKQLEENKKELLAALDQPSETPAKPLSNEELRELKDLSKYHRHSAVERVFRVRERNKRSGIKTTSKKTICIHKGNSKKCTEPAIVLTEYCKKHILSDHKQLLFRPCGFKGKCQNPVLMLERKALCDLHFYSSLNDPAKHKSSAISEVSNDPEPVADTIPEAEPFQGLDDIVSLSLDDISPASLFSLDVFGEPGESTDTALSNDFMQIEASLQPPADILSESQKSDL